MKILIIRYSSLGDIVITTPVVRAIYERFEGPQIDYLIDRKYAPVLKNNPYINEVITFSREESRIYEFFRLRGILSPYDIVFDLQNKPFSRIISTVTDSPKRYTFSRVLMKRTKPHKPVHILDMYSEFLKGLDIELKDMSYKLYYKRNRIGNRAGIVIEASRLSKRLSIEQILNITKGLIDLNFEIVLIGSKESQEMARDISCRFEGIIDTTGLNVEGLIETVSTLSVLITPDSGPLHIASALGIPTVAIFGSTSPERWLPQDKNISLIYSNYECSPCSEYGTSICRELKSFSCITSISPDIIIGEVKRLYEQAQKEV